MDFNSGHLLFNIFPYLCSFDIYIKTELFLANTKWVDQCLWITSCNVGDDGANTAMYSFVQDSYHLVDPIHEHPTWNLFHLINKVKEEFDF